jgi:hypothetical protein
MKSVTLTPIMLAAMMIVSAAFTSTCAKDQERTAEKPMNQPQVNKAEGGAIVVRVVSTADCLNTPPTIKLIQETAIELGLLIDISRQVVTTQEEANKYRFIGSPTVQIDGLDLQPDMRTNTKYGFT